MSFGENAVAGGADPMATIAMLRRALERMPDNVDAMIGLAGMHLRLGQLDAAADWCARAATIAPAHAPLGRVRAAIDDAYVQRGLHDVIGGRMPAAIDAFSRAAALTGSKVAHLYRDLFLLAAAWFDDAARLPPESNAIRLSLPVWGADYVAAVTSGLLRSLLAPGNLPALAETRTVRLEIMTSARDQALLEASPVLAAIRRHAEIVFFIFPDHLLARPVSPDFSYWVMSVAHYASAARARRAGSDVSFFTADMFLADGSLRAAQRLLDGGAQAVLVRALEADHDDIVGEADDGSLPLSLAPADLVRLGLAELGIEMAGRTPGVGPSVPCRMLSSSLFAIEGGAVAYGFHFLPLMVSSRLLHGAFAFDLLTVDTRFVRLALGDMDPAGRVKIICDTDEIAVVSTLRASREGPGPRTQDGDQLAQWAAGWCFAPADAAFFEWCFRHRIVYRAGRAADDPGPCELERSTVANVLSAFRRHAAARLADRHA